MPTGFEPSPENPKESLNKGLPVEDQGQCPSPRSPANGVFDPKLAQLVNSWDALPENIRSAIQVMAAPYFE